MVGDDYRTLQTKTKLLYTRLQYVTNYMDSLPKNKNDIIYSRVNVNHPTENLISEPNDPVQKTKLIIHESD